MFQCDIESRRLVLLDSIDRLMWNNLQEWNKKENSLEKSTGRQSHVWSVSYVYGKQTWMLRRAWF